MVVVVEAVETEAELSKYPQVIQVMVRYQGRYHRDSIKIYFLTGSVYSAVRPRSQILEHES